MPTSITGHGVAHLLLEIAIMATPWNKIYKILLSRNYVYMLVDLKKRLWGKNQEHGNKH